MNKQDMREILRAAIQAYPGSMLGLEKKTGVQRGSISRFVEGKRDLRLNTAAVLADFFGLELTERGKE